MAAVEFEPWPKIARLNRDIVVTEKIDGTNAAILIVPYSKVDHIITEGGPDGNGGVRVGAYRLSDNDERHLTATVTTGDGETFFVFAQSRTRFITPGKGTDNFGFAEWVRDNATALVETLGEGRHYGEWWGSGIQRGYGLRNGERRFSLFNTSRWAKTPRDEFTSAVPGLRVVPVLYVGPFSETAINDSLDFLDMYGSDAAREEGVPKQEAEGIVVYVAAARTSFKVTIKGDEAPKGPAAHANDEENPDPDATSRLDQLDGVGQRATKHANGSGNRG